MLRKLSTKALTLRQNLYDSRAGRFLKGQLLLVVGLSYLALGKPFLSLGKLCKAARLLGGTPGALLRRKCCRIVSRLHHDTDRSGGDLFRRWQRAARSLNPPCEGEIQALARRALVLKPFDEATGERGLLSVLFTANIETFARTASFPALAKSYDFVLGPSWYGYDNATYLLYSLAPNKTFVQAPYPPDYEAIRMYGGNLVPLGLNAWEWVDPDIFAPPQHSEKRFDLVMLANWACYKRHTVLFKALSVIKRRFSRTLSVALVGFPYGGRKRVDVEAEARQMGVHAQCRFYESLDPYGVIRVVSQSRVQVMLSRAEGGHRATSEGLSLDVPCIVYRHYKGGDTRRINPQTGVYADDRELPETILRTLDNIEAFSPREWLLANSGCHNAHRVLNDAIRTSCLDRGLPWARDISPVREFQGQQQCCIPAEHKRLRALTDALLLDKEHG